MEKLREREMEVKRRKENVDEERIDSSGSCNIKYIQGWFCFVRLAKSAKNIVTSIVRCKHFGRR